MYKPYLKPGTALLLDTCVGIYTDDISLSMIYGLVKYHNSTWQLLHKTFLINLI